MCYITFYILNVIKQYYTVSAVKEDFIVKRNSEPQAHTGQEARTSTAKYLSGLWVKQISTTENDCKTGSKMKMELITIWQIFL